MSHETVRIWEFRFAPLVSEKLRTGRRGHVGRSWYLDETYIRVSGRWRYLYRAIDREGNLLDSMLSEHRDKHAALRFSRRLIDNAGQKPLRMTTDKHPAYTKAIRWIIGRKGFCQKSVSGQNSIVPHLLRRSVHVLPTLPVYVHFEEKTSDLSGN